MFKILDIKKEQQEGSKFFLIDIRFSHSGEHGVDFHFGILDEYNKSIVMLDREKYEQHYANLEKDDMYFEDIDGSQHKQIKFKSASPYDLGYCKTMDCIARDTINHLEDGTFQYCQYVSANYITQAAVKQLEEMKEHMESGFCRWGDYPLQAGAFRSGDTFHDFLGILEVLDRFWD